MDLSKNNNKKIITRLATASIKYSKLRNFFIVLTIALSVTLLIVMGLFYQGYKTSEARQAEKMQHVLYHEMNDQQIQELSKVQDISFFMLSKSGNMLEYKDFAIHPFYIAQKPITGTFGKLQTTKVISGQYPEAKKEAAVSEAFCKAMGVDPKIGNKIIIPFLSGDEEFTISGFLENPQKGIKIHSLGLSEEYAESGSQLKDMNYDGIAKIIGAEQMSQNEFVEHARKIGADAGIETSNVNPNNYFVDTLAGGDVDQMNVVTIIVVSIGILFISVLVIYSIFYLSVVGRIRQFGQYRTIGMTKKQLRRMIKKEGLLLSAVGIPIGLVTGCIIAYVMRPDGWDWTNTLIFAAIVAVADIITVLLSILKPARIASKVSPVEALKYTGYEDDKNQKKKTKKLRRKITPFSLARMSSGRNRKKAAMTVISLGIGGILFVMGASLMTSTNIDDYSRQSEFKNGEIIIAPSENAFNSASKGLAEIQKAKPLNDKFVSQIENVDGVKKVTKFENMGMTWESHGEVAEDCVTTVKEDEFTDDMIEEGSVDYNRMFRNDEIIIINNETVNEVFGWQFKIGDKIKMTWFDGEKENTKEFTVCALAEVDKVKNLEAGWFILPEKTIKEMAGPLDITSKLLISTEEGKTEAASKEIFSIVKEQPLLGMQTLKEAIVKNESNFDTIFSLIMAMSMFIIGFSLINLINTLITNVVSRKREFAVIQSIGMTHKQLNKMIVSEGLILAVGNAIMALVLGSLLSYIGVRVLQNMGAGYMHFSFPLIHFIGYVIVIMGIPVIISAVAINIFKKQSLVDRIRIAD